MDWEEDRYGVYVVPILTSSTVQHFYVYSDSGAVFILRVSNEMRSTDIQELAECAGASEFGISILFVSSMKKICSWGFVTNNVLLIGWKLEQVCKKLKRTASFSPL
ncbi:hypothetical protein T265_11966 [Opisthorchis viverrini]|uniref:Uncharacterized protein n=1 Tax=Opisthorchis viverrini TaxID=6198 RepID=A0A074Z136_OPIVI|nr:hypothetical protein T265_11966 [Opisthorchis viverrini]KER19172.1 hypothetical protein T265_11966 [Opisthorchis viverrini]